MRIVVANLSAHYSGRGDTTLDPYDRIVIYKEDGSVSIHSEKGFKPLNYMTQTSSLHEEEIEGELVWTFHSKIEKLEIVFHEIYDEIDLSLGQNDPGHSTRNGTEAQLQDWLSQHLSELDSTLSFVAKEYQTGDGPVDLLAEGSNGALVAVEVKRVAPINAIGQILRYRDALEEKHPGATIEYCIAAVEFKDKTRVLAAKRGVRIIEIPSNWLEDQENAVVEPVKTPRSLFD